MADNSSFSISSQFTGLLSGKPADEPAPAPDSEDVERDSRTSVDMQEEKSKGILDYAKGLATGNAEAEREDDDEMCCDFCHDMTYTERLAVCLRFAGSHPGLPSISESQMTGGTLPGGAAGLPFDFPDRVVLHFPLAHTPAGTAVFFVV